MTLEHIQIMRQCIVVYIYTQTDVFLHQKVQTYVAQDTSIIKQHEHVPDTNSDAHFSDTCWNLELLRLFKSKYFLDILHISYTAPFINLKILFTFIYLSKPIL